MACEPHLVLFTSYSKTEHVHIYIYVSGSSKIQTLCHMTQVLLKLRFTTMERLPGYLSWFSSPKKVQVYY